MFREIRETTSDCLRREEKRREREIVDITKRIVPKTDVSIEETKLIGIIFLVEEFNCFFFVRIGISDGGVIFGE